ncbi:protein ASPARTIC PROTEASE IN GUARD cell 1-like [Dorcoceras hygrometricum]|uniref:Protein ASPARTIC PROTEASE IN GUARD cell 1-like n=1 Tax=Dorcoceras hygrometricum TaxID=472368 RepID=A0A2Z7AXI9_9LAMI|nr:protein ASPARTIC PROTEASE IN GUARD cell 1-like [Dorcoceras hygrometricum]
MGNLSKNGTTFSCVYIPSKVLIFMCVSGHTNGESIVKVFHRHGPCFRDKTVTLAPSLTEVIAHDQSRVDSIHARLTRKLNTNKLKQHEANVPVKSGRTLNSGNYVVTVGLGTPARTLTLVLDTGSDLTWTQCQPCIRSCYKQQEPIFNPSASSSYSNISCNSAQCSQLASATGNKPGCLSDSTCLYLIQYGDQSFTIGYLSKDKLTISADLVVPNFLFGCGQDNQGLFGSTAGLIGLGRDALSLVSQTAPQFGKYFSYCLPSVSSSTGYLSLGKSAASNNVHFTPFAGSQGTSFYFIDIIAITVGGRQLSINQSVFKTAGTIIDSGTVITRLPPGAYSVMSSVFKQQMAKYPSAPSYSILDTCFDLSSITTVTIPKVAFTFGGNVVVDLAPSGILIAVNSSTVCLAFAANNDPTDVGIFGNTQQKTLEVVYDVAGGNLGFGPAGCR